MSIATKTGDKGKTSLFSGERVWKDNERVEAYGTIDELNSFLGEAKHYVNKSGFKEIVEDIQKGLFRVCGELAAESKEFGNAVKEEDTEKLSKILFEIEKEIKLTGFVIPGNSPGSAKLDICRSVARRGERRVITLSRSKTVNEHLIQYLNRLSDLLFIMARAEEKDHKYL
ncbi:MAG: cob(I)yrinic acid a,c-diamide adenosyltransferase [Acidobacteriota bacterium]